MPQPGQTIAMRQTHRKHVGTVVMIVFVCVYALVAMALGALMRFTATGVRLRLYGANPLAARFAATMKHLLGDVRRIIL